MDYEQERARRVRIKRIGVLIAVLVMVAELVTKYVFHINTTGSRDMDRALIYAFFTMPVIITVIALMD